MLTERNLVSEGLRVEPVRVGVIALSVLLGLTGCGPSSSEQAADFEFAQVDSAGILVATNASSAANTATGWTVEFEPDLALGGGGSPSGQFYRIQGLRGTKDNGVLVMDAGSRELRFYDSDGRFVKRSGRAGQGPGEFEDPVLVPVVGTDSLLIFDKGLPWAQVLSAEGEFGRVIRHMYGRPYGGRAPDGSIGFRYMLFNTSGTAGGPETPRPDEGMVQTRQRFAWYDANTGGLLTVDSVLVDLSYHDRPLSWMVPFTPRSSAATTDVGAFIARGRRAEILEYDVDGALRRILRIEHYGREVTEATIDAFIDLERSRRPARYGSLPRQTWHGIYEDMGIPDTLPAFQAIKVDELGWLWAEVYEFDPSQPREWVVFDPDGRVHGTVRTPAGLEIWWIGRDAILGVWRDEFEIEYVHRHRLTRAELSGGLSGDEH